MNNFLQSSPPAILGLIYLILLYALCFFVVIGVKQVLLYLFPKPTIIKIPTQKRTKKPVRSIEINPDDIDRIYVKKSS